MLFSFAQTYNQDCTTGRKKRKKKNFKKTVYNRCYFTGMLRPRDFPEVLWESKETFFQIV